MKKKQSKKMSKEMKAARKKKMIAKAADKMMFQ
jgi:hypothetical protein